jgi:hypothetical protein
LLGLDIVPARAGEAEVPRVHDLDFADASVLAPQRSRVRAKDLVFEAADRRGIWIALKQLDVILLSVGRNGDDAALRVGQRVIIDL